MKFTKGLPETACGYGSTLAAAQSISSELPGLLQRLKVRRLLDAPCGDCNWISRVDLTGIDYVGMDFDPDHLAVAQQKRWTKRPRHVLLIRSDIVRMPLPKVDAVLCRDFLQHVPDSHVLKFLRNFGESGSTWLIATSHRVISNGEICRPGAFRPLDLSKPPIGLPDPSLSLGDPPDGARILGVWHRSDVKVGL